MKKLNTKTRITFLSLCITFSSYSYELFFSNFTDKFLIVECKKRAGIIEKFYQIVPPGGSVIQPWHDANCLETLQWAELNKKLPLNGGLDLIDPTQGHQIPGNKQDTFRRTFTNVNNKGKGLYLWNKLKIVFVPNEIFEQTVKAATKLVSGFDAMVCHAIDTLGSSTQKAIGTAQRVFKTSTNQHECFFNLAQIADAAGKIAGISICTNRQFAILDTGKQDPLTGMPLFIAETIEGE